MSSRRATVLPWPAPWFASRSRTGAEAGRRTTSLDETTDADGEFATPDLPQGTLDVAIEHPQFAGTQRRVPFEPDADNPELVLELFRGGALTGAVVNGDLDPVPGARIVATQGPDPMTRGRRTPAPTAATSSMASPPEPIPSSVSTGRGTPRPSIRRSPRSVRARPRRSISTRRRGSSSGEPCCAATPRSRRRRSRSSGARARAGASEARRARIRPATIRSGFAAAGRYQVAVVFGLDGAPNAHNVVMLDIPDEPEVYQDIVFNVQAITGRVTDKNQSGGERGHRDRASGRSALLRTVARQTMTTTAEDGTFRLDAIDPGTYRVTARARGYAAAEAYPVAVREDEPDPDLELSMERGWILRGRVLDPAGKGVGGALIVVAPPGAAESGFLPTQTDAAGGFRITAPSDGPVNVAAISPRFAPAVQTGIEMPAGRTPGRGRPARGERRDAPSPRRAPRTAIRLRDRPSPISRCRCSPGATSSSTAIRRDRPARTGSRAYRCCIREATSSRSSAGATSRPTQAVVSDGAETEVVLEIP